MRKKILIGLGCFALVIIVLLLVVAMQPATFRVARTATIDGPPPVVFAQVNDFHKWQSWSPWAKLDPNVKNTYDGAESGEGAKFAWEGNNEVGEGRMMITQSKPDESILIDLEFIKPFAAKNIAEFTFAPADNPDQTKVTWAMTGNNTFLTKAIHLVMNMDKLVGSDFEKGLAAMNSVVESEKTTSASEPAARSDATSN
jgi:hypothetical protein